MISECLNLFQRLISIIDCSGLNWEIKEVIELLNEVYRFKTEYRANSYSIERSQVVENHDGAHIRLLVTLIKKDTERGNYWSLKTIKRFLSKTKWLSEDLMDGSLSELFLGFYEIENWSTVDDIDDLLKGCISDLGDRILKARMPSFLKEFKGMVEQSSQVEDRKKALVEMVTNSIRDPFRYRSY